MLQSSTRIITSKVLLVIFMVALSAAARAQVVVMPTDLAAGEPYRLIFASEGVRTAQSGDIAEYNAFAVTEANRSAELAALGAEWTALLSTDTVNALDNTGTHPGAGVPIYRLDGVRIADDYADLWDGYIDNPVQLDQFGAVKILPCFTGTNPSGATATHPVGGTGSDGDVETGLALMSTSSWISGGGLHASESCGVYAISEIIFAGDSGPVPAERTTLSDVKNLFQ